MHVSVVIPTFNRAALLRKTIPALANQQTDDFTYEVIFVSNGSSDSSDEVLKEAAAEWPDRVRYYWIPPTGGPSAPRNVGIRAATGDVVIIQDDDVLPDRDLVLRHAEFHRKHPEPHHAALGEIYVPSNLMDDPMSLFHTFPYGEVRNLDRLTYLHFWSCNVSVKRQFMLESGMFDESFLYFEDVICGHRLASKGMHLHFLPAARGQHLQQLKPAGIPAKGRFTGLWLFAFAEQLPERAVKERFGILSTDLGAGRFIRRLFKRIAFRLVDNPATLSLLRFLGAESGKRSRVSDLYYQLVFRHNLLAGYYQARREATAGRGAAGQASPGWANRGES